MWNLAALPCLVFWCCQKALCFWLARAQFLQHARPLNARNVCASFKKIETAVSTYLLAEHFSLNWTLLSGQVETRSNGLKGASYMDLMTQTASIPNIYGGEHALRDRQSWI